MSHVKSLDSVLRTMHLNWKWCCTCTGVVSPACLLLMEILGTFGYNQHTVVFFSLFCQLPPRLSCFLIKKPIIVTNITTMPHSVYVPPGDYAGFPGCGLLRLHSTYRHDLKIYASDEGRVQMTAAAFAKVTLPPYLKDYTWCLTDV